MLQLEGCQRYADTGVFSYLTLSYSIVEVMSSTGSPFWYTKRGSSFDRARDMAGTRPDGETLQYLPVRQPATHWATIRKD